DGYSAPNDQKPYIVGYPSSFPGSTVLSRYSSANSSYGLPVTLFGSLIDSNYLAPTPASFNVYFDLDGGAHSVGDFVAGAITEGYVGLELWDSTGSTNNYGWARVIYDAVDSPKSLTLVDYAYETTPFEGIIAGATNEVGVPDIYIQPQSQTNGIGAGVQFSVTFLASPAPTLQWQVGPASGTGPYTNLSDVGIISGSTNATLTLNGATSGYQGDYRVVISNSLGAVTSTPAALTLVSPVVSPSAPVLLAGSTASFQVSVTGGLTPTFQWQMDGTNLSNGGRISGATTANLHIGNLQTTDAGSYDVILNFGSSPSPSAISVLTVVPGSQENLYDQAVMADSPSVYYRLNETGNPTNGNLIAYDNVGGFNGTYGIDVTNGYAGVGGPDASNGFPGLGISNSAVQISPTDTNSWITLPPWNLNSANVTFTAWVNPTAITNALSGIIMTGTTNGTFAGMELAITTNDLGTFSFGYQWDEGPGNGEGESPWFQSGLIMPTNEWSMVALAITSSNATLYMFDAEGTNVSVDDSSSPNQYFDANGSTNQVMPFNTPEYIGADPNGGSFGSQNFTGMIDNVAVFNQTMTADQLGTLYSAALGVYNPPPPQISTAGSNIVLTWPIGTLLQSTSLLGPWTTNSSAGSPYTVAPTGISMFYKVVVP
ncbi:MAG TPA: immunoglobulin domain-containing protein, partial [Verrucomicrobiae bacterium]